MLGGVGLGGDARWSRWGCVLEDLEFKVWCWVAGWGGIQVLDLEIL